MAKTLESIPIDKMGLEHYFRNYEEFLGPMREEPIRLLELGIAKGDSLRHWLEWLPNARIAGLDINPVELDDDSGRLTCYRGEQQDFRVLDRIGAEVAPDGFDAIIDDASHVGQLTRLSFWHLYHHHLKPGGLYFIEDWGTGYWPAYPDGRHFAPDSPKFTLRERAFNSLHRQDWVQQVKLLRKAVGYMRWNGVRSRFRSHDRGMVGFVKELVDECGKADITHAEFGKGTPSPSRLEWVRISHGHVIVKKPAPYPPTLPSGSGLTSRNRE